ncbi:MAG: N-acetylmannosamine-6-phosphate 2-epimerase [Paludibacter sp.]|nr:N-acetylmannosamine-6-phosphate 2-epimerase [Paludibacter sp.]
MTLNNLFNQLKHQLIVSCQAEGDSPFNSPKGVTDFAIAAIQGGASGIRTCGIEKTRSIVKHTDVPVIGLTKAYFPDGTVCITGTFQDVSDLVDAGTHIIAVDGTFRLREEGLTGPEYISKIKEKFGKIIIMADISTEEEAVACREAGADCISTTLCGYTPETLAKGKNGPAIDVLRSCVELLPDCPVFAEGRYNTPQEAALAIDAGAWAVVVGSAITRPHLITQWFVEAIKKKE